MDEQCFKQNHCYDETSESFLLTCPYDLRGAVSECKNWSHPVMVLSIDHACLYRTHAATLVTADLGQVQH